MADLKNPPEAKPAENGKRARRAGRAFVREFLIPIGLALIFIQFFVQAFKIPSASMERSLRIGDFLLGLKFPYGSPIPFTHTRLPALTEPRPGDVMIFRYPGDPTYPEGDPERYAFVANLFLFGNLYWDRTPGPDEKSLVWYAPMDFIKRAVAQSGQTLDVEGPTLRIDGEPFPLPPEGLYAQGTGSDRPFMPVRDRLHYRLPMPGETLAFDTLSLTQAAWMRSVAIQENPGRKVELQLDLVRNGAPVHDYVLSNGLPFSRVREVARTGFLRVPPSAAAPQGFSRFFSRDEFNQYVMGGDLEFVAEEIARDTTLRLRKTLAIDGTVTDRYTVKKTLYFMMGDNRDNSSDSRFWGPLSRDNVKAKAFILYYSFENDDHVFSFANPLSWFTIPFKIRWNRLGRIIE